MLEEMIRVVLASRLMSGGVIPASTGRNVVSVGRMHPVIIRIVSFSATSSFLVWVLRHQAGDAYSAALYTSASAPVRSIDVYAPQLEPTRQRRKPFLAFTLLWRLSRCFCTSATGRESHQGRPGCYSSEEEHRSQVHRAVDVFACYLGGMLSSCSVSDASGAGTRIETACLDAESPQFSPRSYVQLAERGRQHSHIASMLSSGCHLYIC